MATPTQEELDAFDWEEHNIELIKEEFKKAIEQLRIDLLGKIDRDANIEIRDYNELDERINDITKQLKSLRDTNKQKLTKYLAEINIDEQLENYDEKRRNVMQKDYDNLKNYFTQIVGFIDERLTELDDYIKNNLLQKFNIKNRDINIKIEEIKKKIDHLMEGQLFASDADTEVVEDSSDDGMDVEELQQRVDDILKF